MHEYLDEQPRTLGQVQTDELRVKKAARRPLLVCTDGLVSYIRAMRETFRDPVHTGTSGRLRLRPWRHVCIAQVVKRYERWRVVETERRMVDGTPARVEALRRRSQGGGVINTAYIERLHATFRERLAPLAHHPRTLHEGMFLVGTVYNFCTPHESLPHMQQTTPAMAAWTSLTSTVTPARTMVLVTTVHCGVTPGISSVYKPNMALNHGVGHSRSLCVMPQYATF